MSVSPRRDAHFCKKLASRLDETLIVAPPGAKLSVSPRRDVHFYKKIAFRLGETLTFPLGRPPGGKSGRLV